MNMFSQIPPTYEAELKQELWGCHQFMNMSYTEIYKMPTRDRRFYISRHNAYIEKQNQEMKMGGNESLTSDNFRKK